MLKIIKRWLLSAAHLKIRTDDAIPLLSVEYKKKNAVTYAYCESCDKTFKDDVPNWGSIRCPHCDCILLRGLKEEHLTRNEK